MSDRVDDAWRDAGDLSNLQVVELFYSIRHDCMNLLDHAHSALEYLARPCGARMSAAKRAATYQEIQAKLLEIMRLLDLPKRLDVRARAGRSRVSVGALVTDCVCAYEPYARRTGVTIASAISNDLSIDVDSGMVSAVIHALLSNAMGSFRALPRHRKSEVSISAQLRHNSIDIVITDNGTGIPPGDLERVFLPGFSTKQAPGYGLYLSQRIVQNIGGTISVASRCGEGTEVTIVLPVSMDAPSGVSNEAHNVI